MRLIDVDADRFGKGEASMDERAAGNLSNRFRSVRAATLALTAPLSPEDQVVQSMPDASPVKWHLAHTTWFWETFILVPAGVAAFDPAYAFLFNSYYDALGARHPRPQRGLLTRPDLEGVLRYRAYVDEQMQALLDRGGLDAPARDLVALGLAHEEQHQELLLTDVLHLFAQNPLKPAYRPEPLASMAVPRGAGEAASGALTAYVEFPAGLVEIGAVASPGGSAFAFDNEGPRHKVYLAPFRLADRLVTNAQWRAFIDDGGYARPELWLSDGWACVGAQGWSAPLYWDREDDDWRGFGLVGASPLDPDAPVTHVSFYEADAFARWSGRRLPTEMEWEHAASQMPAGEDVRAGNFRESGALRPLPLTANPTASAPQELHQMFGDVWEWTASPYAPYPGFRPAPGAVGEYNGKFMINQMVLRGGSCVTPAAHIRASYRNFFQPHQRWQFTGVRLADDWS
jgi:ergothioneine biosynthesis protein EgtB